MFGRRSSRAGRDAQVPPEAPQDEVAAPPTRPVDVVREGLADGEGVLARTTGTARVLSRRYRLGRLLGTGGMSEVHLARDLLLQRDVALKLFHRETSHAPDHRLQEIEARVVAALNHYALTTLLDAGIDTDADGERRVFLVMEYVSGETLRERLRRGPMEASEACWMGFDLAEGLDSMHQSGFLHRDVKPANILISDVRSVRPVVAKLTDFGIAMAIGQPDLSEYTVGTAAYLSPEQVEGHDARLESDVYSLGLVLLEAITGRVVFPGSVEVSAFERLVRDPVIPADVPRPVADLIARMTRRVPEERVDLYQVAVELQQFLADDLLRRRAAAAPPTAALEPVPPASLVPPSAPEGPDSALTTLVRLAAGSLGAAAALLVLEDQEGATLVAQHGWDAEALLPGSAAPLAFPSPTTEPWVLPDALAHPVARTHPLFEADPRLQSAAGAPLLAHGGRRIGWLAVLDRRTRAFGAADLAVLADFASVAAHEIELRTAARRVLFDQ